MAGDLEARHLAVSYHPESHRERIGRNLESAPEPLLPHHLADRRSYVFLRHLHSALGGQHAQGSRAQGRDFLDPYWHIAGS